jgi:G6PDH family F420-dependent oxidoreductase
MLEEAVKVIRLLWQGGNVSFQGHYYTVDQARLYSRPDQAPPLVVAASGKKMARLAARIGDGLVGLSPDKELVDAYLTACHTPGLPRYAQMAVCWAKTVEEARCTAYDWWPLGLVPGQVIPELPLPSQFDALSQLFDEQDIERAVVCGPETEKHVARIQQFIDAGFTHIYIHQVGPNQEGFFDFYQRQILPRFR